MTQHTDLIERLRRRAWLARSGTTTDIHLIEDEAINALEAQAREIERLRKDAEELAFLDEDLLYWVDRAVGKGNANTDIEEAYARYEAWRAARHEAVAAMAMKGQT